MRRICVFCGSSTGDREAYADTARELGRLLAARGIGLVYGGGRVGLMGILADTVLEAGGEVHGVIPRALALREVMHEGVTRLEVVSGMHPRKARMSELADAFMALPGGYGTFEELFEMITWCQLGIHAKPIGVLNAAGYFDHLLAFLDEAVGRGFVRPEHRGVFVVADRPAALLEALGGHEPPAVPKWTGPRFG